MICPRREFLRSGLLTVAQFSYWGNYLPLVYPTYLRGTGEAFAANIGGRMLGTSAALLVTSMVRFMPGGNASRQLAYAAGIVGLLRMWRGMVDGRASGLPRALSLEATPDYSVGKGKSEVLPVECRPSSGCRGNLRRNMRRALPS